MAPPTTAGGLNRAAVVPGPPRPASAAAKRPGPGRAPGVKAKGLKPKPKVDGQTLQAPFLVSRLARFRD